jgi:RNA polymerase sigma factor (sigma-70 family)
VAPTELSDDRPVGPAARPLWAVAARDFEAWRAGDQDALERLVRRISPMLWQLARAYRLDRAAAEDVVQNTWLALVRGIDAVRDPEAVLSWLTVTTRREAWRTARLSQHEDSTDWEAGAGPVPTDPSADRVVLADAEARQLWRHVAALPDRCRRLLRVIAVDERPDYRGTSDRLDMPTGSIGPTRRRCLDKLRDRLALDPEWSR